MSLLSCSVERGACRRDLTSALFRLEMGHGTALGAQEFDRQMHEQLLQAMSRLHTCRIKGDADHLPVDVLEEAASMKANGPDARPFAEEEELRAGRDLSRRFLQIRLQSDRLFKRETLRRPLGPMRVDPLMHCRGFTQIRSVRVAAAQQNVLNVGCATKPVHEQVFKYAVQVASVVAIRERISGRAVSQDAGVQGA